MGSSLATLESLAAVALPRGLRETHLLPKHHSTRQVGPRHSTWPTTSGLNARGTQTAGVRVVAFYALGMNGCALVQEEGP
jgi:hypothetical protein